jgi:hypothetical protein
MERRMFLTSMVGGALSAAAGAAQGGGTQAPASSPEFYMWRHFILRNGPQPRRLAEFMEAAAVPALNRAGHQPIGAFEVVAGVPGPTLFLLIPSPSLDRLAALEGTLERDDALLRDGKAYFASPATDPAYVRQDASIFAAVPKMPRLELPPQTAARAPRLFELRIYESASERAHRLKVQMFAEMGELEIFRRVGLRTVFFSRTLAGQRLPSLVYLLVHDNMAAREKSWDAFRTDPEWRKLASTPGYADAEIVSNITTILLRPAAYSQI